MTAVQLQVSMPDRNSKHYTPVLVRLDAVSTGLFAGSLLSYGPVVVHNNTLRAPPVQLALATPVSGSLQACLLDCHIQSSVGVDMCAECKSPPGPVCACLKYPGVTGSLHLVFVALSKLKLTRCHSCAMHACLMGHKAFAMVLSIRLPAPTCHSCCLWAMS